jgi:hypothetical protein
MSFLLRRFMAPTRPQHRPVSPKARLWLRALEDRLVPATFTVTNTGDTGSGSGTSGDLRYCITQSNAGAGQDPIGNYIDATGVTGTITLTSPLPAITQYAGVSIVGPGASQLTINANGVGSVFTVTTAPGFSISGITLTGGRTAGNGGAIDAAHGSEITINDSVITGNSAGEQGGGIYDYLVAPTIQNSTISNNRAGSAGGGIGLYYAQATNGSSPAFTVSNSTIADNTAPTGGGIFDYLDLANAQITDSTITGNTASNGNGGGIYSAPFSFRASPSTIRSFPATTRRRSAPTSIRLPMFTRNIPRLARQLATRWLTRETT